MQSIRISALTLLLSVSASTPLAAQAFNLDVGDAANGIPPATYGAAASQTGSWTAVDGVTGGVGLADISGAVTSADCTIIPGSGSAGNWYFDNVFTTGDDGLLMDDLHDVGPQAFAAVSYFLFTGVQDGAYDVYTYSWAPDNPTYLTSIEVTGSPDPPQIVGGSDWTGAHVLGGTYTRHQVSVTGGNLEVVATTQGTLQYGSINGFQLVPRVTGIPYCFGNSASGNPCPCGNDNDGTLPPGGCQHDDSSAGARLEVTGNPSVTADTLLLVGSRGPVQNSTLFFQANNDLDGAGSYLGDGIRCAGGGLIRLKVKTTDAGGNADSSPMVVTARSASLGHVIQPGETLYYQWWIRDPAGSPCGNESNTSNGFVITWEP